MRKRNLTPRHVEDFYSTPYWATLALLTVEKLPEYVWEPACGDGEMSEVLRAAGHEVYSTDLIDRGYGHYGVNFLDQKGVPNEGYLPAPSIVTNPPYRIAEEFVQHALTLSTEKICMFMRLAWLAGAGRKMRVFDINPPARVWVMSARPTLWHGGDTKARATGGATDYAWFVWERGALPVTRVGWLARPHSLSHSLAALERATARLNEALRDLQT